MKDIILDTILDAAKLFPFLFLTFLLMEYLEHKLNKKSKKMINKAGKFGPLVGSILGAIPQCGFSAAATNLFSARIITIGTLIAIYLSTSDEMFFILASEGLPVSSIIYIILIKVLIGMSVGFVIDLIIRKNDKSDNIESFCEKEHCHCEHGLLVPSFIHTIKILLFIIIISFALNCTIEYLGEDFMQNLIIKNSILGPFVSSLIGLIPNCAASVVITELYVSNVVTFGSMMAGLLTGSGVALLLLFRINKDFKENMKILITIYTVGVVFGIIFNLLGVSI